MASPITERITTQFRVEMFNIFNRRNLPVPNGNFSSGSFGRISDTIGDYNGATGIGAGEPFNVQLALKLFIAPPFCLCPIRSTAAAQTGGN